MSSLDYHLAKRVAIELQWVDSTSAEDYLSDLQRAARRLARVAVYERRGGIMVAVVGRTLDVLPGDSLGEKSELMLIVVYSVDHDMIASGYQFSSIATVSIPEDARWLE